MLPMSPRLDERVRMTAIQQPKDIDRRTAIAEGDSSFGYSQDFYMDAARLDRRPGAVLCRPLFLGGSGCGVYGSATSPRRQTDTAGHTI